MKLPRAQLTASALCCLPVLLLSLALAPVHADEQAPADTAIVLDFENGTAAKVQKSVRKELANRFANKLDAQDAFDTVLNEREAKKADHEDDSAVVVAGVITKVRKKTADVRILVGVEEGISFFDAKIKLKPGQKSDSLQRGDIDSITLVEDTVVNKARDEGESVREYVEDAAQLIARAYRIESKAKRKRGKIG